MDNTMINKMEIQKYLSVASDTHFIRPFVLAVLVAAFAVFLLMAALDGGEDACLGVSDLNAPSLCGVVWVSDTSLRAVTNRWGMGKVKPGRPILAAKFGARFSCKTYSPLIISELMPLNRQCLPDCRFYCRERLTNEGETGNLYVYTNKRSYV